MGASESTAKSNGTKEEEDDQRPAGASIAAAVAAGVAVAGVAAWGISRMLSDDSDSQQKQDANKFRPETSYLRCSSIPSGRFELETSRSCKSQQGPGVKRGPSGFGGILRDGRGNFVEGFHGFIADIDSLTAEFHAILKGLQLLDKRRYVGSILVSDYKPPVDHWINEDRSYPNNSEVIDKECWDIIEECKRLKKKNNIEVNYRPRESKKRVHKLARLAISKRDPYVVITTLPDEIT